jgi:phage shock protein PspC (stress-responsive transcriptional regulator)
MFFAGLSEGYGEYYQSGTYMIIVGYVLIFIFQAISAIKKEK